jgi:8-oxo-dGTP diphosphatase
MQTTFGHKLRVRACGICTNETGILLVSQRLLGNDFWSPPGGGIDFGESAETCLKREFAEETGLTVEVGDFLFACEFIQKPLHAIELFFNINSHSGHLALGSDPELPANHQLLTDLKFIEWHEIKRMDHNSLHGLFRILNDPIAITQLRGYYKL